MIERRFEARIAEYGPRNAFEQELVIHELLQQLVLVSLAKSGLFSRALFHGGTCLRLLYGTDRFSEDLDFLLNEPETSFDWKSIAAQVREDCLAQGIGFEAQDRSRAGSAVKTAFLKTDSIGKLLLLDLPYSRPARGKIRIKLEIDTNPPAGSLGEIRYLDFPVTSPIATQTLESSFALKSHALLCRSYTKGRDWWDLAWYIRRRLEPSFELLANALAQQGPWANLSPPVGAQWFLEAMRQRVDAIDWPLARADIARFLPLRDQPSLDAWGVDFFRQQLARMEEYLRA